MILKKWVITILVVMAIAPIIRKLELQPEESVKVAQEPPNQGLLQPSNPDPVDILRAIEALEQTTKLLPETLPITIPFEERGGHLLLPVQVNDSGLATQLILDSGARMTLLDANFLPETALHSAVKIDSTLSYGLLTRLMISDAVFENTGVLITNFNHQMNHQMSHQNRPIQCLSKDGFIGANTMRHGVWQIDYQNKVVTLAETIDQLEPFNLEPFNNDTIALPFTLLNHRPAINLALADGQTFSAIVDTGWEGGIYLTQADYEHVKDSLVPAGISLQSLVDTLAGSKTAYFDLAIAPCLKVGDLCLENTPIIIDRASNLQPQSLIGNEFLKQFRVTLDWQQNQVYLEPIAGSTSSAEEMKI